MKQTIDTLERLWAAIGDRLLGKGPLDKAYANAVCREITDEIARLKALSAPSSREDRRDGWIPVGERLPDAGQYVLVYVNDANRVARIRAFYAPKHTMEQNGDSDWIDYSEEKDEYFLPEGWYEANDYEETHWHVTDTVTHWRPLPEPPAAHLNPPRENK